MMRVLSLQLGVFLALSLPANAGWETRYSDYRKLGDDFRLGYLEGFLQGNLFSTYVGDNDKVRAHFKTCLAFANHQTLDRAMSEAVRLDPELAKRETQVVLIKTLFSMCGPAKS